MWWLRSVYNRNHFRNKSPNNPEDVNIALKSVSGVWDLSVYAVQSREEAKEVAVAHSMSVNMWPEICHYILIQPEILEAIGFAVKSGVTGIPHEFLNVRHHNIVQLDDELRKQLVRRLLDDPTLIAEKVRKPDVISLARQHLQQYPSAHCLIEGKPKWVAALANIT